jgi:hypothetical protein
MRENGQYFLVDILWESDELESELQLRKDNEREHLPQIKIF